MVGFNLNFFDSDYTISDIILACTVPGGTGNKIHNNRPSHGIALNLQGEKTYSFSDGKKLTVKENDIIFLPKYSSYTVDDVISGDCYAINFDIDTAENFIPYTIHVKNPDRILLSFKKATSAFTSKNYGYAAKCKGELYLIISSIIYEKNLLYSPSRTKSLLIPALNYIHSSYYKETVNIDKLASLCNISPAYFRRLFSQYFGTSPIKYINALKLKRAKELLSQNEFSTEYISELCGFTNIYYFCRLFKQTTGMTPREYKQLSTTQNN